MTDRHSFSKLLNPKAGSVTSGTVIATTSGTSWDFTGLPTGIKCIMCSISGLSTNGTSAPIIQIGDSGGIETTGYSGSIGGTSGAAASTADNLSAGFALVQSTLIAAGSVFHGVLILSLVDSATNTWSAISNVGDSTTSRISFMGGSKALSATLDRVRLTTTNGTDAGDAGSFNILYWT